MSRRILAVAVIVAFGSGWAAYGALAGGSKSSKALFSTMSGKKEVDATTGKKKAGDPDGRGSFTAVVDGTQFCYGLTVKAIGTPTAAHVHKGGPKTAGPAVIPLEFPATVPGASSGCAEIDAALAAAIQKNPRKYYVNVHNAEYPGGAVRGQVFGRR